MSVDGLLRWPILRRPSCCERLDDDHTSAAAAAWEGEDAQLVGDVIVLGLGLGCGAGQHIADAGDVVGAADVGKKPVKPDAMKTLR
jgi:hypothetical protein